MQAVLGRYVPDWSHPHHCGPHHLCQSQLIDVRSIQHHHYQALGHWCSTHFIITIIITITIPTTIIIIIIIIIVISV